MHAQKKKNDKNEMEEKNKKHKQLNKTINFITEFIETLPLYLIAFTRLFIHIKMALQIMLIYIYNIKIKTHEIHSKQKCKILMQLV